MSFIDTTYYTENKKQVADIKRAFRNSLIEREGYQSLELDSSDFDYDFSSTSLHVDTQGVHESDQDRVRINSSLILDDTFTLTIDSKNDYFNKNNQFTLFMDNETRLRIIEALSNVVVHKHEEE
jgi:hypothetical protein